MSPATPLDATAAVSTDGGTNLTIRVPKRARRGLHLLAVIGWPGSLEEPDFEALGWDELARETVQLLGGDFNLHTWTLVVLRRATSEEQPATHAFAFTGAIAAGDAAPAGALVVATGTGQGVASDANISGFAAVDSFVAPTAAAAAYSDVALRAFYAASVDEFFFAGSELLVSIAGSDGGNDASLAVTWSMPEQAGPVGTLEGELATPADGVAATFTLPAQIAAQAPQWDDEIAIGLPTVGV